MARRGELKAGEDWVHEGILDTRFVSRYAEERELGGYQGDERDRGGLGKRLDAHRGQHLFDHLRRPRPAETPPKLTSPTSLKAHS
jgi:hypothetical protein